MYVAKRQCTAFVLYRLAPWHGTPCCRLITASLCAQLHLRRRRYITPSKKIAVTAKSEKQEPGRFTRRGTTTAQGGWRLGRAAAGCTARAPEALSPAFNWPIKYFLGRRGCHPALATAGGVPSKAAPAVDTGEVHDAGKTNARQQTGDAIVNTSRRPAHTSFKRRPNCAHSNGARCGGVRCQNNLLALRSSRTPRPARWCGFERSRKRLGALPVHFAAAAAQA